MEKENKFIVIIKKGGWAGFILILFVLSLYVWAILSSVPEDIIKGFLGGLGDNIKNVFSYFWYLFFNFILKNILAISTFVYATLTFFILRAMRIERYHEQGEKVVKEILIPFKKELDRNIEALKDNESPWSLIDITSSYPEIASRVERVDSLNIAKENTPLKLLYNTYSNKYLYHSILSHPSIPTKVIDTHNKKLEEMKSILLKLCRFTLRQSLSETFLRAYGLRILWHYGYGLGEYDNFSSPSTVRSKYYDIVRIEPDIRILLGNLLGNLKESTESYADVVIRLLDIFKKIDAKEKKSGPFMKSDLHEYLTDEEIKIYEGFREGVKKIENELEPKVDRLLHGYKKLSTNLYKTLEKRITRYIKRYGIELERE